MSAVPHTDRADSNLSARTTHQLYERYGRQIHAYCLHQLRSREEAEDAVQTTFLNAFRGLQGGTVPHAEQAWIYKIAQNVCSERRTSSARRLRLETPNSFEDLQEIVPAQSRESAVELIGLEDALASMPENQRRAILLREWQGLSYREISEELTLSQAAVEMLIFRARRTLAGALEQPAETKTLKRKVGRGLNLGSVLAALKSLLTGGAAVKAVALAVAAGAVSVTANAVHHTIVRAQPRPHATAAVVPQRSAIRVSAPVGSGQTPSTATSRATGASFVFVARGGVAHVAVDASPVAAVAPPPAGVDQPAAPPVQSPTPTATPSPAPSETPKPSSSSDSSSTPASSVTPSSKPATQSAPAPAVTPPASTDKKGSGSDSGSGTSKPSTQSTPAPAATPVAPNDKKAKDDSKAKQDGGKGKSDPVPGLGTFTAATPAPAVTTTPTTTTTTSTPTTTTVTTPATPVDSGKGKSKKQQDAAPPTVTTTTSTTPTTTTTTPSAPPPPPVDHGNGKDKKAAPPVIVPPVVTTPVPTTTPAPSAGDGGKNKGHGNGK